jgi:sporulation protein YlmC with PRC-barrel domain
VNNIYLDTQWLHTNVATQTNITEVINGINNLQTNISYIKNNMFYQGNATGAFIVDYLSTVYGEPGRSMDLWVLTSDLLGNQKTVSAAECSIMKGSTLIDAATIEIGLGTVHANWTVNNSIEQGSYYWNCTLTGSSVNIQVPFYLGGSFEITSLSSASPKYPNENAVVEATFASSNGSAMEPDSINMTILKPNYLTIWKSADKSEFTLGGDGIWYWADMIEAIPTTGTYYVHMNASKNGISSSKTTQFRIATGGPYLVFLACPDSSVVGSNLNCNVIIKDEGEAPTESTSTIWVDTNGNSLLDAGEPQTSFSVETQPLQNVTQAISINVPSTFSIGNFVVRVDTEYLNSVQPHSTASDSVTFTSAGEVPVVPSGGGGGGGGGGAAPIINKTVPVTGETIKSLGSFLEISTRILDEYKLVSPEEKVLVAVTLYNLGTEEIKDATINYCIENSSEGIIKCNKETVTIYTKVQLVKEFFIPKELQDGRYFIVVKVDYANETVESKDTFEIVGKEKSAIFPISTLFDFKINKDYMFLIIIGLVSIASFIFFLIILSRRKGKDRAIAAIEAHLQTIKELNAKKVINQSEYHAERGRLLQRIQKIYQSKTVSIILFGAGLFALVRMLTIDVGMTGYTIGGSASTNLNPLVYFIFLIGAFGLLALIHIEKIKGGTEKINENLKKKYPCNSIKGLINKKVYSENGRYIGKVNDVLLGENKVESLKIKLDKKHKFKAGGIVVEYKHVRNVGEIIIINKKVSNHLRDYKDALD